MRRIVKQNDENNSYRAVRYQCVCIFVLAFVLPIVTEQPMAAEEIGVDAFSGFVALGNDTLDGLRGGFVTSDGLEINVGIERLVFINDSLQSKFAMDLSHINRASLATGASPAMENYMQIIQSGSGNTLSPDVQALVASGMLQVIQNSLNDQKIGHITGVDIEVKNYRNILIPDLGRMMDFEVTRSLDSVH